MNGRKQGIVVTRSYWPTPDHCVHALKLLLEGSKKGSRPAAPSDDAKEIYGCAATKNLSR